MKFNMRLLAAALALAAAGTASAQVNAPTSANGSDIYFYAVDTVSGDSFVLDLGTNMANFLPTSTAAGTGFVDNVSSSAAWASFLAGDSSAAANLQWAVIGGIAPNNGVGTLNTLSTTMINGSNPVSQPIGNTRSAITELGLFTSGLAAAISTAPTSGYFTNDTNADNPLQNLASTNGTLNGFLKVGNLNFEGQSSNFYNYSGTKTGLPTAYGNTNGVDTFSFDGNNLTFTVPGVVAAVPEPSSIAMMIAGLLMLAGVARRRNSK